MPIEIRELIIKAEVETPASRGSRQTEGDGSVRASEEIIQEIVDRVMEVIERKSER